MILTDKQKTELIQVFNSHDREYQIGFCLVALNEYNLGARYPSWEITKTLAEMGISQDVINEGLLRYQQQQKRNG